MNTLPHLPAGGIRGGLAGDGRFLPKLTAGPAHSAPGGHFGGARALALRHGGVLAFRLFDLICDHLRFVAETEITTDVFQEVGQSVRGLGFLVQGPACRGAHA